MKKIVALLAAMAVLALAASCGGGAAPAATPAPVAATPVPAAAPEAASNEVLFEDFSMKPFWFAVANSWGDGDKSTEAVWDKAAGALECKFAFAEGKPATYQIEEPELNDWSGVTALKIDVTNKTGVTLKALVAVCTGADWVWQEAPDQPVAPGETKTLKFGLMDGTLKSAATNWAYAANLDGGNYVRRLAVRFWGEDGLAGSALIDNVILVK